jgi:hypothetical protein
MITSRALKSSLYIFSGGTPQPLGSSKVILGNIFGALRNESSGHDRNFQV